MIFAFMTSDMFWSYFAVPIGVTICFGPAMVVGLLFHSTPELDEADARAAAKQKTAVAPAKQP